jgi:hypothetical protein
MKDGGGGASSVVFYQQEHVAALRGGDHGDKTARDTDC